MIRRDYILRMLQEFLEMLSRISALKKGQLWREAGSALDEELGQLAGVTVREAAQLTETELLARLVQSESTPAVREKALMLTTLLKEAGDVAAAQQRDLESQACYLKALHLLVDALGRGEIADCPHIVPRVEALVLSLGDSPLPLRTQALLMQHYERTGEFGKAEDALFAIVEAEPGNAAVVELGTAFYERLQRRSDAALVAGNLPRAELAAGLAALGGGAASSG
jgi:hypothetical protein